MASRQERTSFASSPEEMAQIKLAAAKLHLCTTSFIRMATMQIVAKTLAEKEAA